MENKSEKKKKSKIALYVFLIFMIGFGLVKYNLSQKQKRAQVFIGKIITSVLEDTEFYKRNSHKDAIDELENNKDKISENYLISIVDYSWGVHEAYILFDNKTRFYADVVISDNIPFLYHFGKLRDRSQKE